ncbi:metalloregulator ArsR/SmtB family transcription factor [Ornithinibacillus sp. L9]|uniref:Metalloregulator ArsR/SmtB family transcription factor n=1 Tax=Ornithinibacillus caprae TaxID=2678566 RepID=A0A6N8FPA3_9BACI|nr:metalloregulator ArsR/SmtB family transcription factor [Ornithinibacillus caprae]MUK89288.1 metalloregulator ArsR/SmtB family transcription factor [Ornithinibacillus caprae]
MERDFFILTYPQTKLNIKESLGVSIFTNIQLLDYFLNNSTIQSEWIKDLSNRLPDSVKEDLRILRTLFAHGVILRDFYIKRNDHLSQDWDVFIDWWKELSEQEVLELVIYGIREIMDYYYKYLPTIPSVEKTMMEVSLEVDQLKDAKNRENAIKAVLESWSVERIDEILPLYNDLTEIKERIICLVNGFWEAGFKEHWESKKRSLSEWKLKNMTQTSKSFGTNEEAIFNITGLYPDTSEIEIINRAHCLTFIPVPNMGRLLSFVEIDKHGYLMFDPFLEDSGKNLNDIKVKEFSLAFEGLGDFTRLQIINLLAENKEMFAQQIVTKLKMKQSTISRHLNQLHQSNLVNIRQDGNTKYFSINKDEIKKVMNVLETFLK